jgi:hypothetical protein
MDGTESGWILAVEFTDRSDSFAYGVEFGRLYQQMKHPGNATCIDTMTLSGNREVLRRGALHLGWVPDFKQSGTEGWDHATFRLGPTPPKYSNPRGLHVV